MVTETSRTCEGSELLEMCIKVFGASMRSMGVPPNLTLMANNHATLMASRYTQCVMQVENELDEDRRKEIMRKMEVYTLDPLIYMQNVIEECIRLRCIFDILLLFSYSHSFRNICSMCIHSLR